MESMIISPNRGKVSSMKIRSVVVRYEQENLTATILFDIKRLKEDTKAIGAKLYAQNTETIKQMINDIFKLYGNRDALRVNIPENSTEGELWSERMDQRENL